MTSLSYIYIRFISLIYGTVMCNVQEVDRFDDLNRILQKDGFRGVYQVYFRFPEYGV